MYFCRNLNYIKMFEEIVKMASSQISEKLSGEAAVPQEQVSNIASTAGESILGAIGNQISSGNFGGIQEMLSGASTSASNPAVNSIAQNVVSSLVTKCGLSESVAATVANTAVPYVMNMFNDKVGQAKEGGLDVGNLISGAMAGGAGSSMLGGLVSSFLGGSESKEGESNMGQNVLGSILGNFLK
jgi:hypothetical protein